MFFEENDDKSEQKLEKLTGSKDRFHSRISKFIGDGRPNPKLRYHAFWILHNCVIHPLLAIKPGVLTSELHELTSQWLNHREPLVMKFMEGKLGRNLYHQPPKVNKPMAWFIHNAIAHPAIGFFPSELTFNFHDKTAVSMEEPGWV